MSGNYILNKSGEHELCDDALRWALWFETADRVVAQTDVGDVFVSTVFLALDHNFVHKGPPILYETMIFGGLEDGYQTRYCTREDALAGHQVAVELVNRKTRKILTEDA